MDRRRWKVPISVCLDPDVVDEVDRKRGGTPRSEYLRELIESQHKPKSKTSEAVARGSPQ